MDSVSQVSVAHVYAAAAMVSGAEVSGVSGSDVDGVRVSEALPAVHVSPLELSITNAATETAFNAAAYDNRGISNDTSPRGVEIDRVKMIQDGFEHMRNMIQTISEGTAEQAQTLDMTA